VKANRYSPLYPFFTEIHDKHDNSGYVYIFSVGENLYKVGKARNWKARLFTFQAANPEIKMVHVVSVRNRHKAEIAAHEYINKKKVKREIFRLDQVDVDGLLKLLSRYAE
jgi:hypothetical protein